jgi:hypothetical protein
MHCISDLQLATAANITCKTLSGSMTKGFCTSDQCQTPARGSSLLFLNFVLAEYHDNRDTCMSGEAEIGENSMNIWYTCSRQESSKTLAWYPLPVSWCVYWCKF